MGVSRSDILAQIDRAIGVYETSRGNSKYEDLSDLGTESCTRTHTILLATIERLTPPGSTYRDSAREQITRYGRNNPCNIPFLLGILK